MEDLQGINRQTLIVELRFNFTFVAFLQLKLYELKLFDFIEGNVLRDYF